MRCLNCDNTGPFVLVVELAAVATAPGTLRDPDWSLSAECPACNSTDVTGDPGRLLVGHGSRTSS